MEPLKLSDNEFNTFKKIVAVSGCVGSESTALEVELSLSQRSIIPDGPAFPCVNVIGLVASS